MCDSLVAHAGMNSAFEVDCSVISATNATVSRRRLQDSDSAMLVNYEILVVFLLNTELGQQPNSDATASDLYNSLVNALQGAAENGNLTTLVRTSGVDLLSNITIESLTANGFTLQVVDQTPTPAPSRKPSSDGDDDTVAAILNTPTIVGIAIGGCASCLVLGAILYYIYIKHKQLPTATDGSSKLKPLSTLKVLPVDPDVLDFLDLEKIYPSSPDIVGADALGHKRALWRDESIEPLEDRRMEQYRMADDLASYLQTLQTGDDPYASRTPSVHLEDEYASNSRAVVLSMENPEMGLRNNRDRGVWYMDKTYSGKERPESMQNPELELEGDIPFGERNGGVVKTDHAYNDFADRIPHK